MLIFSCQLNRLFPNSRCWECTFSSYTALGEGGWGVGWLCKSIRKWLYLRVTLVLLCCHLGTLMLAVYFPDICSIFPSLLSSSKVLPLLLTFPLITLLDELGTKKVTLICSVSALMITLPRDSWKPPKGVWLVGTSSSLRSQIPPTLLAFLSFYSLFSPLLKSLSLSQSKKEVQMINLIIILRVVLWK